MTKRIHVAIGPITQRASWKWLGPHLAESLAESCTVHFFHRHELPLSDVVIFIKERPELPLQRALDNACQIIYMPVDFYRSQAQLEADAPFFARCSGLLVHSRRLGELLVRHDAGLNPKITYVDHPNLYGLTSKPPFRHHGDLLWIGDLLNLPYLLRWRESVELPYELKILSNARRTSIGGMAMTLALARRLGVKLVVSSDRINGIPLHEWSAAAQHRMMAGSKAALDIKGGEQDFSQFTKPPTKGQQFIVSGISFAANSSSAISQDLLQSGFEVADVGDQDRWFSHEYWQHTRAFSPLLEERIKPEAVARIYQRCLKEALGRRSADTARACTYRSPGALAFRDGDLLKRWQEYAGAWHMLRSLGASWKDTAPFHVAKFLEMSRTWVPGYVRCRQSGSSAKHETTVVSVLLDDAPLDGADPAGMFSLEIPDTWELIGYRLDPYQRRAGMRCRSLRRWPRRSLLRDRMLAAARAEGNYLAFVTSCDADLISWITQAAATLEEQPRLAMIWRNRDAGGDIDHPATFMIRRTVWRALGGFHPGHLLASTPCGEFDLLQRVRLLGYTTEAASAMVPPCNLNPLTLFRDGGKVVVYTAITNRYDRLQDLDQECVRPARQIAFVDDATRSDTATATALARNWEVHAIDGQEHDPNRAAKLHKIRPELFFPDTEYSLWIDGNVSLIYPFDMNRLIELFLADTDLCIGRHYARACIYQEAEACKQRRLDSSERIDQQVARYRREGFPEWYGLNQAVVILRRHSARVRAFDELWWQEICQGSRRDQLSFNYVQWKTGLPIGEFPLPIQDNNGLFTKSPHEQSRPLRYPVAQTLRTMLKRMEAFHLNL